MAWADHYKAAFAASLSTAQRDASVADSGHNFAGGVFCNHIGEWLLGLNLIEDESFRLSNLSKMSPVISLSCNTVTDVISRIFFSRSTYLLILHDVLLSITQVIADDSVVLHVLMTGIT
ncbi:hypothetical protein V6N13_097791 [Hibiscus sabdariffa]|uniref:Uncharacterized protein n=1 Tax=Hibiscus sabdariffa TaxID=183260 RepID=A0ABR2CAP9_9ROSI